MGWFDDDFYSTKVSEERLRAPGWRDDSRRRRYSLLPLAVAFMLGVLFTLLVLRLAPEGRSSVRDQAIAAGAAISAQLSYNEQIKWAAGKVQPAVVSVISKIKAGEDGPEVEVGLGSGIVYRVVGGKALIATNHHVVANAEKLEVVLIDGQSIEAEIVGSDALTDLAVLAADSGDGVTVAELGRSEGLQAGETAIAIGNPLGLGFSHSITVGVVSAPKRLIDVSQHGRNDWKMEVIQTDAAINQGNSGGALANLDGQVIGINSMKVLDMGVEGLGFAIPIDDAKPVLDQLVRYGKVKRPYLGVYTENVDEWTEKELLGLPDSIDYGVVVLGAEGPAKDAGLSQHDVIVALDGTTVRNTYELRLYLYEQKRIGDKVRVTYYRDGKKRETTVTLREWEPEP
jgi:serine protease Do